MSRIATTIVCECCGQPIKRKPAARKAAPSFKGYDDFVPAYNAARRAIIAELGERWYLVPGASQWARIPASWASCKVYGRTSHAPRDRRLPAARFWPSGTLPTGPEYAAAGATVAADYRGEFRRHVADHRKVIADMRAMHDAGNFRRPELRSVAYLDYLAGIRQRATVAARAARFAEAA